MKRAYTSVVHEVGGPQQLPHQLLDLERVQSVLIFLELVEHGVAHVFKHEVYFVLVVLEDGEQIHDVGELEFAEDRNFAHCCFDDLE